MAQASVAQWIEHQPVKQKISSLIPCQGTCLGCRPRSQLRACKGQLIDLSLAHQCFSLSPSLPLSLKIKKIIFKKNITQ